MNARTHHLRRNSWVIATAMLLGSLGCGLFGTPVPTIQWATPTPYGTLAAPTATATSWQSTIIVPTELPAAATATATIAAATAAATWTAPPPTWTPPPQPTQGPPAIRIQFEQGATQSDIAGQLPLDGARLYVLRAMAGQFIDITATPGALLDDIGFSLIGADGTVIKPMGVPHLRGVVPSTQDYYLQLISLDGAIEYMLSVLIPVRITFAAGATSASVQGTLAATQSRHYVLRAMRGQTMEATTATTAGEVRLIVWGADGLVLQSGMGDNPNFKGLLLSTQDYIIAVQAGPNGSASYSMVVTIPPP